MAAEQKPFEFPGAAIERIREATGADGRGLLFTSDLSINEFAVIKQAGFHPLGLVMGSCIYHCGFQFVGWNASQEVSVLSAAMYEARALAMRRMETEATQLGADGVVGVALEIRRWGWAEQMLEFVAVGTAVKADDGTSWRTPADKPFTSALSGQDFSVLLSTGYQPVGLVLGTCVWHVAYRSLFQAFAGFGKNMEMVNFTEAHYAARETAMVRMQLEAKNLGAEGVVGVLVAEDTHVWESHVIEFLALGTAVRKASAPRPTASQVIDLGR
jgi:uncharacterized protein YbjQ (UPF0145 family)